MTTGSTTVRKEVITLPMARLGQPSNLPRFRWQQPTPSRPTPPNTGLTAEESSHGFAWGEDSILPYQVTDDYDREQRSAELETLVIENDRLRAVVAPSLGGRLIELKDLVTGRDLVFRNPVFQPANLASLNAWFSGGIEWNGLIPGHTPFTCAPVFAGVRDTPQGPIVRIYEFDRIVEATWQIDLFMPAGSAALFAHGRIANPSSEPRLAYWWTNVAAPLPDKTRVLSPTEYSVEHIWPGNNLGRCDFPRADWDASYPDNWENATSVFFRAPAAPRLFIASVDGEGYGLAQTSTREMLGRKFFYFGCALGGQNWMDYLARPGEGRYLEIQSGIAPTQNQRFVLGGGEELDWTEVFMPVQLDGGNAHDADYNAAVSHAAAVVNDTIPAAQMAEVDAFLREQSRLPLTSRHSVGAPWGGRQERLLGKPLARGLDFTVDAPADFWDELASGLTISTNSLREIPNGIVVSKPWIDRVVASAEAQGTSWLHALILATAALDQGDKAAAAGHVDRSLALQSSWAGYRLRALLSPDVDTASGNYLHAWNSGAPPELAIEIATHFMTNGQSAALKHFVENLPHNVQGNERIVLARAVVAANDEQFDEVERLVMSRQFASIREGETLLSDLWVRLRRGRLEQALQRPPTRDEVRQDLERHPMPRELDLRMHVLEDAPA